MLVQSVPYPASGGGGGGTPFSNVVLLMGFEGADGSTSFVDESNYARTMTANGSAQIDTATRKFGSSSFLAVGGGGDVVTAADSADLEFGTGKFTIDAWVRWSSIGQAGIISKSSDSSGGPTWALEYKSPGGQLAFTYAGDSSGGSPVSVGAAFVPNLSDFYHVAVDYDLTKLRLYVDGVMIASSTTFTGIVNASGQLVLSQQSHVFGEPFGGWIDELRIIKGSSLYASDAGFARPAAAFSRSSVEVPGPYVGPPTPPPITGIRGSRIAYVNGSSIVFTLPAGSADGDRCVILGGHGYDVQTPAGWTNIDTQSGSNFNGAAFSKILAPADIAAGSVTISFGGGYLGVVAGVTFIGRGTQRTKSLTRNGGGATTRVATTDGTPAAGDYAIYFAAGRVNAAVTSSVGTQLQQTTNSEGSGVLAYRVLGSSGADSTSFSFASAGSGDYSGIIVFQP